MADNEEDLLLENLSPSSIVHIAWDIREGEANPFDAKRLLAFFCELVDKGSPIPYQLNQHLRDAFRATLDGDKNIDVALGLSRKKGRPKADERLRAEMALAVLKLRLDNTSHQVALQEVSERFGWGETVIGEAWANHKLDAVILLRIERSLDQFPWSEEEVERLCEIFKGSTGFVAPEKSKIKPA